MKQPILTTGSLLHVLTYLAFLKSGQHVTLQHAKGYFLNNNSSSHWCLSLGPVRFLNTGLLKFYVFSIAAAVTGFDWFGLVFLELFDYSANCSYFWRQKFGWALLIFASHLAKAYQMFAEWLKRWLISVTTPKERMLFSRGQHSKPQPPKASQVLSAGSFIFVWPGALELLRRNLEFVAQAKEGTIGHEIPTPQSRTKSRPKKLSQ